MSTTSNRHGTFKTTRLPRQKQTIPVQGDLEDDGQYFRCWNCGFVIDSKRDAHGNSEGSGVSVQEFIELSYPNWADFESTISVLDDHYTVMKLGMDGEPLEIRHNLEPVVGSGCPFCGTLNWR